MAVKGKKYPNFFENLAEIQYRLVSTIILYKGEPYTVMAATDHKPDKIVRLYLWPIGNTKNAYPDVNAYAPGSNDQGEYMDKWLETPQGKESGVLRKHINSPEFNNFRPFPLGMLNSGGSVYWLERTPQRMREQGLTRAHINCTPVKLDDNGVQRWHGGINSPDMRDCIVGAHPSLAECLKELKDPLCSNKAVAFHRELAIIRGPFDGLWFVNHKGDTIGLLEDDGLLSVAKRFAHRKELLEATAQFPTIRIK